MLVQPASVAALNHERLRDAISRLWAREVGQSHRGGDSQAVGISMIVGMSTFSIAGD